MTHSSTVQCILRIAESLRGPYQRSQYEQVILPFTILRRLDCILAPNQALVWQYYHAHRAKLDEPALEAALNRITGVPFHNYSEFDLIALNQNPKQLKLRLRSYIQSFSSNVQTLLKALDLEQELDKLDKTGLLPLVVSHFSEIDLHPQTISNAEMGALFEALIREFNQSANQLTGDYFTPPEVVELMVQLVLEKTERSGKISIFDPTCGTGGMLFAAQQHLRSTPNLEVQIFGQDFNNRAYAIAAADALMNGNPNSIRFGDSLINDQFKNDKFDYFLANPPFGIAWRQQQSLIVKEHHEQKYQGRFGAGLPRVSDGSLLFLQHLLAKFKPEGSRCAIVFSGSPLFTGAAGSGESNIRRWIIENDWLEAIVALPDQIFHNTSIGTYIWVLTNRKAESRRGKIQIIDGRDRWQPMRKSQGEKRRWVSSEDIAVILKEYKQIAVSETSKVFHNRYFGYWAVPIERPLRLAFQITNDRKAQFLQQVPHLEPDLVKIERTVKQALHLNWNSVYQTVQTLQTKPWKKQEFKLFRQIFTAACPEAEAVRLPGADCCFENSPALTQLSLLDPPPQSFNAVAPSHHSQYEADPNLKDTETVCFSEDIERYFEREVLPHLPDAWINKTGIKVGYEINVNREFYQYIPPRSLEEITADILALESEISASLKDLKLLPRRMS